MKKVFRFMYRANSVLSVFKQDAGRNNVCMNLLGFHSNKLYMYPDFSKLRKYYLTDYLSHAHFDGHQTVIV